MQYSKITKKTPGQEEDRIHQYLSKIKIVKAMHSPGIDIYLCVQKI